MDEFVNPKNMKSVAIFWRLHSSEDPTDNTPNEPDNCNFFGGTNDRTYMSIAMEAEKELEEDFMADVGELRITRIQILD